MSDLLPEIYDDLVDNRDLTLKTTELSNVRNDLSDTTELAGFRDYRHRLRATSACFNLDPFANTGTLTSTGGSRLTTVDYLGNVIDVTGINPAIRGARLATTVAEGARLGPELVTDPTFNNPLAWTAPGEWVVSSGSAVITDPSANYDLRDVSFTCVTGRSYRSVVTIDSNTTVGTQLRLGVGSSDISGVLTGTGTFEFINTVESTGYATVRPANPATGRITITSFSVREVIPTLLPYLQDGTPLQPYDLVRDGEGTKRKFIYYNLRQDSMAYAVGDKASIPGSDVRGLWMECTGAGITGASVPTVASTDIGSTIVDGGVTWLVKGYHCIEGIESWAGGTNLCLYSEDFSLYLTSLEITVSTDVVVAPDGNMTADKLVATSGTGRKTAYYSSNNNTPGDKRTISVFAKPSEYSLLFIGDVKYGDFYATFDIINKTVTSTGGIDFVSAGFVEDVANGFVRTYLTYTQSATNLSNAINIVPYPAGATIDNYSPTYTGDDVSGMYLWGRQLENSDFPTPYIPTTTATATRTATVDKQVITGITPQKGAIAVRVVPGAGGQIAFFMFSGGAANVDENMLVLTTTNLQYRKRIGGVVAGSPYFDYTHTKDQPFVAMIYWDDALGMGIKAFEPGQTPPAFATNPDTQDAPLKPSGNGYEFEFGSRTGANQFAGQIEVVGVWSSKAEADAKGWGGLIPEVTNPAHLFQDGSNGTWIDLQDTSTIFTDSAGTTLANVGDVVGLVKDKSGNGNDFVQATTSLKPILRQDADGNYYLEMDGVDDKLTASFGSALGNSTIAFVGPTTVTTDYPVNLGTTFDLTAGLCYGLIIVDKDAGGYF